MISLLGRVLRGASGRRLGVLGLAAALTLACVSPAAAWWDEAWSYRMRVNVNTAESGAAISGPIGRAQVLVRLHTGNFAFADAKSDGGDIRVVAGDDSTPLRFHVEKFDAAGELALLWVDVSNVAPNTSAPLYIYYGNKSASAAFDARGTYAPDQALVYHFGEDGPPRDSTANGVNAETAAGRDPNGLIGNAAKFDGLAGVRLPAAAAMTFAAAQPVTISMWVRPASDKAAGTLYAAPGALTLGISDGVVFAESGATRVMSGEALSKEAWSHVAFVSDGTNCVLYVNGVRVGEAAGALPAYQGVSTLGAGFAGEVDEFQIAKAARTDGQIALAFRSQGVRANLLTFDTAEETSSGHSYFGVLINALTPDAWAVIIILGLMSIGSWAVMVSKVLYVNAVSGANEDFLLSYREASAARGLHEGLPAAEGAMKSTRSSLARLYEIGTRELDVRVREGGAGGGGSFALAPQSIAAIRSALDAGVVREGQSLNRLMVLLTIAISGGPFLGLLGTVVGVMITFAAVAAAGDVNINAIAPGIAAALLATVAGLAVAIPALFGYNYLLSRTEAISADMSIFVDELEKRIAETYRGASNGRVS